MRCAHWPPRAPRAAAAGRERAGYQGEGRRRAARCAGLSRRPRDSRRRWCSSTAAAGSRAISKPMTGRRAILRSRPARSSSPSIIAARRRRAFPAPSRTPSPRRATSSNRIAEFGGDAKRLGVAGDSAGGNLAAATAIACRDAGIKLAAQLLVYPVTDVARELRRRDRERALSVARRKCRRLFPVARRDGMVLRPLSRRQGHGADWRVSPLRAKALPGSRRPSSAPPGSIRCATRARPMREALQAAGVADQAPWGRRPDPRLFRPWAMRPRPRSAEAQRARADFKALLARGI